MRYHIQTTPIWDAFNEKCECPLCRLYAVAEERFLKLYSDEAVMEPDYRVAVNKRGFCSDHLKKLYKGQNKLGISLQVNTRIQHVIESLSVVNSARAAKKQAELLEKTADTCVICDALDEIMERYAYTVAQMYDNEADFPKLFSESKGFCLPHYSLLLRYASYAGKSANRYAAALSALQLDMMKKTNYALDRFAEKFDYRSTNKHPSKVDDALEDAVNMLKGKILE